MFEDKTKDLDDPGMYALSKLTEAFQNERSTERHSDKH